jgi:hypothetical protein
MTYEVDLPDDIVARLSQYANGSGEDIVHLIQVAVAEFVDKDVSPMSRRLPDPPLSDVEQPAHYDLPRSQMTLITPDTVLDRPARLPDSLPIEL